MMTLVKDLDDDATAVEQTLINGPLPDWIVRDGIEPVLSVGRGFDEAVGMLHKAFRWAWGSAAQFGTPWAPDPLLTHAGLQSFPLDGPAYSWWQEQAQALQPGERAWSQGEWTCGTACCLFGHMAVDQLGHLPASVIVDTSDTAHVAVEGRGTVGIDDIVASEFGIELDGVQLVLSSESDHAVHSALSEIARGSNDLHDLRLMIEAYTAVDPWDAELPALDVGVPSKHTLATVARAYGRERQA
jgi:hypothetical protein